MASDRHQIERKIRLLEDSLKSGIIDKDEFDKSKARLDSQLAQLSEEEQKPQDERIQEETAHSSAGESERRIGQALKTEEKPQSAYYFEEKSSYKEYFGEGKGQEQKESKESGEHLAQEAKQEEGQTKQGTQEGTKKEIGHAIPLQKKEIITVKKDQPKKQEPSSDASKTPTPRLGLYIWLALAVALGVMLLLISLSSKDAPITQQVPTIACSLENPCESGYICENPGTESAACIEQKPDPKVTLTTVTDESCTLCDTSRVTSLLSSYFPSIEKTVLDDDSEQGKALISLHDAQTLPLYILSKDIEEAARFNEFKTLFAQSGDSYVLKQSVSAAPLYRMREETPSTLTLFYASAEGASVRAIRNLIEFRDAFPDAKITLLPIVDSDLAKKEACANTLFSERAAQYIICSETTKANCAVLAGISDSTLSSCASRDGARLIAENKAIQKELSASTPSFLLNNNLRVSGVQSADALREKFCAINDDSACESELSTHLV